MTGTTPIRKHKTLNMFNIYNQKSSGGGGQCRGQPSTHTDCGSSHGRIANQEAQQTEMDVRNGGPSWCWRDDRVFLYLSMRKRDVWCLICSKVAFDRIRFRALVIETLVVGEWNLLACGGLCCSSQWTPHTVRTKWLNLSLCVVVCGVSHIFKIGEDFI